MITSVIITNARGLSFTLDLWDVSSGYSVRDIRGLHPVRADLVSSTFASLDEEEYQAGHIGRRNIVFELGMEALAGGRSIRELRNHLYQYFMPKSEVDLRFVDSDGSLFDIHGHVEEVDAPLFTQEPMATISILCFKSDFVSPELVVFSGNTVTDATDSVLTYAGSRPTGVEISLQIDHYFDDLVIQQNSGDGITRSMPITFQFQAGDELIVRTIPGAKRVYLNREGLEFSILYGLSPAASWLYLKPGNNLIRINATGTAMPYTLSYIERFGGL